MPRQKTLPYSISPSWDFRTVCELHPDLLVRLTAWRGLARLLHVLLITLLQTPDASWTSGRHSALLNKILSSYSRNQIEAIRRNVRSDGS